MGTLFQDLRYALRMLLKKPAFTVVAVMTLALGIGANSTIFSFVNGILLRPLPYRNPDRLMMLDETVPKRGIVSMGVSFPNFADWREQNHVFEDIAAFTPDTYTVVDGGEPEQISGARVSAGMFEILGVSPILGRAFFAEEDHLNQDAVVILSYGLWQRRFAADPNIIGQTITTGSRPRTVIGVMPQGFKFPEVADLWVPMALNSQIWNRNSHGLGAIARLKEGVTIEQAQAEMNTIALHIEEQNPVTNDGKRVSVFSLHESLTGDYRQALMILFGVVGFVLLIACANVANLLLVRASVRQKEVAIRSALGASPRRIFRQLLTESLLLGLIGGVLGLVIAVWGRDLLLAAIPGDMPFWMKFNLDARVLGFTLGVSILTGLVFGVVPALQAANPNLNEVLKEGGRDTTGAGHHRLRGPLVVSEIALSLVLLVGAGLMMRSFTSLQSVNSGFNPANVMTMRVPLPRARYPEQDKQVEFFQELIARAGRLPGVESVGAISNLPLSSYSGWGRSLTVEGRPVLSVGEAPMINHCVVTPNYFQAMGITLLSGRDFTDADGTDAPGVTIIDERLAQEYWPNETALGKRIRFGPPESNEPWKTIVGVVAAVRHQSLDRFTRKGIYVPHRQITDRDMTIVARASDNPASLATAMRKLVLDIDSQQAVTNLLTMNEVVSRSVWQPRFYTILFSVFAVVALILGSVGIYGVMSYSITQRTHELGIRMALGAQTSDVLKLVIGRGLILTLTGVGIGLAGALALTRLMTGLLFGVAATDLITYAGVAALLTTVSLVACYIPARRATKIDPMVALRYE